MKRLISLMNKCDGQFCEAVSHLAIYALGTSVVVYSVKQLMMI
jgi:hypothetical protein